MKILFVSHSPKQTVITVKLEQKDLDTTDFDYQIHLYNHKGGYTEMWSVAKDHEQASYYHKQLCEKCNIQVNM